MSTSFEPVLPLRSLGTDGDRALHSVAGCRAQEVAAAAPLPPHTLMQRAGLAVAQFALAIAPHARKIWIPCGPGNNGGDGFETALHLKRWGKEPVVTILVADATAPADAQASRNAAMQEGVTFANDPPEEYDLCIDALFGIGAVREFDARGRDWVSRINSRRAPVIAVDVPSGLNADTGKGVSLCVRADFTLSLLTLKPGLFTADGRQACGAVWLHRLGIAAPPLPIARLNPPWFPAARAHNTHKGTYGDVAVVGGNTGMVGAALLAASAALHGGAGRVYVALLGSDSIGVDVSQPELMLRPVAELALETMTVVAGCGAGTGIDHHVERLLKRAHQLVLDADALNAIGSDVGLQALLTQRQPGTTVLTPHPLEAARLLQTQSTHVQADRLQAAQSLADRFQCTVALKGSGTVIAAPHTLPNINVTGNALLATAGTGDVLAGLIGAYFSAGGNSREATCRAVYRHGQVADDWGSNVALTAGALSSAV